MSGLELVLAVLPLVLAAAEYQKHIIEGGKTLLSPTNKNERQLDFYYELFDELSLLASTLEELFSGLPSFPRFGATIKFSDQDRGALEELLGNRAIPFQSILSRLLKSLEDIISDRSIDISRSDVSLLSPLPFFVKLESFRLVVESGSSTTSLAQRFRFTKNNKSRQYALKKIKDSNETLERLLRGGSDAGYYVHKSATKKPRATRLRRFSEPLFTKIAGKWPSRCECDSYHEARLCLWNCCSKERIDRFMDSIDLMVSVSDVGQDGTPWQESLILIPSDTEAKQAERGVRFAGVPETMQPSLPRKDVDTESICSLVNSAYGKRTALQIVFESGKLWQTRARRRSLAIDRQRDVTLSDLLTDRTQKFSLREQRILAVVLAHAALHCSDGPWLSENWNKEHISFFKHDTATRPDIRYPFLKLRFNDEAVGADDNLFCVHPNPSLLSLGILLLEIYLEDKIESRWADTDLNDGVYNENTNLTAALRLLEESEGKVYEGYRAAIRACLEFELEGADADALRQKIYEDIVLPLELELEHGFHITPEDLHLAH